MNLTFLDYFAGVGGFRRGMEMAGHKCLGHCEIDKYANKSYMEIHNLKEDEWFGTDIRKTNADELPRADVWCFGFPCQDISVAGKQLGFNGERSSLFFAVTRLIRDTKEEDRPKYLFIENVKNLLSVNGGTDFLKLLIELDEIGYDAEWQVINSAWYLPQNRERTFIIGHLRGRSTGKVFPITEISGQACIEIIGTTKSSTAKGTNSRSWVHDPKGIVGALGATDYKQPKQILIRENTKKGYVKAYEGDGIRLDHIGGKTGRGRTQPGMSNTLTTGSHAGVIDRGFRIRKLTPKECWRLQGWNDDDFEKASKVCSDSQLYKQAGNGVTVPVIYDIAKRLR
ncbi:MAG: DNA cytosine methyltransferase [Clostridium chrysemydis]|uniref:DNA cytosine methyltransferase n=1 Tax=Clostridium chrysemydis TaxID=2665504 RepID=UPI003F36F161